MRSVICFNGILLKEASDILMQLSALCRSIIQIIIQINYESFII